MIEALDLYRGAGGWSVACQRLGIVDYGVEIMPEANATAEKAGHITVSDNVWSQQSLYTDGLIASPPCQTFSQAGKGEGRKNLEHILTAIKGRRFESIAALRALSAELGDERSAHVLMPLYYACEYGPYRWIALEQVPTVLPVWRAYEPVLQELGYHTWTGYLHAEQYGVPQTRKRAFVLASLEHDVTMLQPTHSKYHTRDKKRLDPGVKPWVSMAEALGWADATMRSNYGTGGDPSARGVRHSSEPAPTVTSKIDRNVVFMGAGAGHHDGQVPREPGEPSHTITGKGTAAWCYERPSTTIVGTFRPEVVAAPGYGSRGDVSRQNAPGSVRVTVQEAGILQSFPADYPWQGAKGKQYLQVGNAIPPLLAQAALEAVL